MICLIMMELKLIKKVFLVLGLFVCGCSSISFRANADEFFIQPHIAPAVKVEQYPSYWYQEYPRYFVPPRVYPTNPYYLPPTYIIPSSPTPYYYLPAPIYPSYPSYVNVPVLVERGFFCKRYHWTYQRRYW